MQFAVLRGTRLASALRTYTRRTRTARAFHVEATGEKLQDWLKSPAQIATFGPRVTLGVLLSAPERLTQLYDTSSAVDRTSGAFRPEDLTKVQELLTSASPPNEKANILLEEVELRLVDCLERGASVESDIYQNVRSLLPEDLQKSLPEESPFVPSPRSPATAEPVEDDVTYDSTSVAAEKSSSERTGLSDAIVAVRTAQSSLTTNTSAAREKMLKLNLKEEREFLENILKEIDVTGPEMEALIQEAQDLMAETAELI